MISGASLIAITTVFGFWKSAKRIPTRFRIPLEGSIVMVFLVVGIAGIIGGGDFLTYILPKASVQIQPVIQAWMLHLIEIGIGVGGTIILTSILFALLREETDGLGYT